MCSLLWFNIVFHWKLKCIKKLICRLCDYIFTKSSVNNNLNYWIHKLPSGGILRCWTNPENGSHTSWFFLQFLHPNPIQPFVNTVISCNLVNVFNWWLYTGWRWRVQDVDAERRLSWWSHHETHWFAAMQGSLYCKQCCPCTGKVGLTLQTMLH